MKRSLISLFLSILAFLFINLNLANAQVKWHNYTTDQRWPSVVFQDDLIWYSNDGGLARLNRATGEKFFYTTANSDLPSNQVFDMKEDADGNLWLTVPDFLAKFDGLCSTPPEP